MTDDLIRLVDTAKLREQCDPFASLVWDLERPLTREEIAVALTAGDLFTPADGLAVTREGHIRRIAWFVRHGWEDPISIDVGVPSLGCHVAWPILDGNHRFAAALYRGDSTISTSLAGEMDVINDYLYALEKKVRDLMVERGFTLAVAESLTGGKLSAQITAASGASRYYLGGVTAYTLDQKAKLLGVDRAHAAKVNCVSARVAQQMAEGVRHLFGADVGVATTGYAEPCPEHGIDVPLAYIAVVCPKALACIHHIEVPNAERTEVQSEVATSALIRLLDLVGSTLGNTA